MSTATVTRVECFGCLDEFVPCRCGERVRAGSGHPDCGWFGFWLCVCGHCTRHHRQWWDVDSDSGFGCDWCDCSNSEVPDEVPS